MHLLTGAAIGAGLEVAQQIFIENRSLSELDGNRIVGSAAIGAVTGGASALGKASVSGVLKVAGHKATLATVGERVAVGASGIVLGASAGVAKAGQIANIKGEEGELVKGAIKGGLNAVSPIPGAGTAAVKFIEKVGGDDNPDKKQDKLNNDINTDPLGKQKREEDG